MSRLATAARTRALAGTGEARQIRINAGVGLREAAHEIDVHPTTLLRWERGEARPRVDAAVRWGALLAELKGVG